MYININQTVSDKINFRETNPDVSNIIGNEMTLGLKEPINFIIDGAWQINT